MEDRLAQFLKSEELTAVKFAEIMEVQPSSISHLLAGRNKPNFEFVSRMLLRFPNLNPDWIINGIGNIYKSSDRQHVAEVTDVNTSLITDVNAKSGTNVTNVMPINSSSITLDLQHDTVPSNNVNVSDINELEGCGIDVADVTDVSVDTPISSATSVVNGLRDTAKIISRVILFYADGSFEEYSN